MSLDHRHLKNFRSLIAGRNLFENEDDKLQVGVGYNFLTGIVQDVISNPYEYLNRNYADTKFKLKDVLSGRIQSAELEVGKSNGDNTQRQNQLDGASPSPNTPNLAFINSQVIETMPMNSIFAYIVDDNQSKDDPKLTVCYPFFPPHLSLPLKSGEYVWIICENVKGVKYYYWMCRKVGALQIDDLNYTNMERIPAINDILEEQANMQGNSGIDYTPGYSLDEGGEVVSAVGSNKKSNMPIALSNIMRTSYSYNTEFTGEPVPRLAKDCSDIVLQGSNNGGLHITTEKFSDLSESEEAASFYVGSGNIGETIPPFRKPLAPAIDLFVGRKINSLREIKDANSSEGVESKINTTSNNSKNTFYNYVENDKLLDSKTSDPTVYDKELNDGVGDATDVAARLYMSNQCSVDLNFGSEFDVLDSYYGPSIVSYSQHNRVVGLSDVRLVSRAGQSFIDMDPVGNIVAKSSIDDGQQFLSLRASGESLLHAKGKARIQSYERIELAVRTDDDSPTEPYILHSQLAPLLKKLAGDAAYANFILETLLQALSKVPPIGAVLAPIVEVLGTARDLREQGAAGQSLPFEIPEIDEDGNPVTDQPGTPSALSLEAAGNNITQDNIGAEAIDVIDVSIKSTKIFGE